MTTYKCFGIYIFIRTIMVVFMNEKNLEPMGRLSAVFKSTDPELTSVYLTAAEAWIPLSATTHTKLDTFTFFNEEKRQYHYSCSISITSFTIRVPTPAPLNNRSPNEFQSGVCSHNSARTNRAYHIMLKLPCSGFVSYDQVWLKCA